MELYAIALLAPVALAAPLISRKTAVPCVVIEMAAGMVLGDSVLGLVHFGGPWTSFLFEFGLIYLLFLAGVEVEAEYLISNAGESLAIGIASTVTPFALGYALGSAMGVSPALLGVIMSTTSVGVVLPTAVEMERDLFGGDFSFTKLLIGATAVSDMLSMLILALVVQQGDGTPLELALAATSIVLLIPLYRAFRAYARIRERVRELEERYHFSSRLSLISMIVLSALAEASGVHSIVGAFFAGVLVSELTKGSRDLLEKLSSFGYALFIPMFFLLAGVKLDLPAALAGGNLALLAAVLILSFVGKVGAAYAAARTVGQPRERAWILGSLMWAKLSLVVAAAEAGLSLGMIDEGVYSTLILFALLTVVIAPLGARVLGGRAARVVYLVEASEEAA